MRLCFAELERQKERKREGRGKWEGEMEGKGDDGGRGRKKVGELWLEEGREGKGRGP